MATPLITTKLHVPSRRRTIVARPRLEARLAHATDAKLLLVSAPAGFGKTTLVAEWLATLAAEGAAVAWVSLDDRDNDPAVFWAYVLAALSAAVPGLDVRMFAMLLCYTLGIMGILTPYATGPSPVYFGSGFVPRKDFWRLGAIFGFIYLAVLLAVGVPWMLWMKP